MHIHARTLTALEAWWLLQICKIILGYKQSDLLISLHFQKINKRIISHCIIYLIFHSLTFRRRCLHDPSSWQWYDGPQCMTGDNDSDCLLTHFPEAHQQTDSAELINGVPFISFLSFQVFTTHILFSGGHALGPSKFLAERWTRLKTEPECQKLGCCVAFKLLQIEARPCCSQTAALIQLLSVSTRQGSK